MIPNLKERQELWNRAEARGCPTHDLVNSLPYPFEDAGITPIFRDKHVLEIGPGNGRQYERIRDTIRCASYCIADIAKCGLDQPVFDGVDGRFILYDWTKRLPMCFDVIHFWYVLHHIRHDEMREFFRFLARHLTPNGLVAFNCPEWMNVQGPPEGDGLGTTYSDEKVVLAHADPLEMVVSLPLNKKSTGNVFLLRKV